jgi:hypothetical protein
LKSISKITEVQLKQKWQLKKYTVSSGRKSSSSRICSLNKVGQVMEIQAEWVVHVEEAAKGEYAAQTEWVGKVEAVQADLAAQGIETIQFSRIYQLKEYKQFQEKDQLKEYRHDQQSSSRE